MPNYNTLPNGHKMYQMAVKYSKWPQNKPTFSNLRFSRIYPNLDFGFENKPSGNPGTDPKGFSRPGKRRFSFSTIKPFK
jgi:hypothetical protein